MVPVLSPTDHAKAKEFRSFLQQLGLSKCLEVFVDQWQELVNQQEPSKERDVEKSAPSGPNSTTSVRSRKSFSPNAPSLSVLQQKCRVVTAVGVEDDLWEPIGKGHLSPPFAAGAGAALEAYRDARQQGSAALVSTTPYMKEQPPSRTPLESINLRMVYKTRRTGFEEEKDFPIVIDSIVAGQYQILQFLDSAVFSRTMRCMDLKEDREVCLKVMRNSKDFFDQSIDEIKLLNLINSSGETDENCVIRMYDFFYYKEHMFIVTELLRDNLYQFSKFNREEETEFYFTLARLQAIARQILKGLCFLHGLDIIHCDLKPENILIKSFSKCEVKIIDFGSSCFLTDNLSSYIQSRCYRAPEVVLGCKYDGRIDVWSLGAILAELATGRILFENNSLPHMLASICSVCGSIPESMLHEGRNTHYFVSKYGAFYEYREDKELVFHFPVTGTQLSEVFGYDDPLYIDFVRACLTLDYSRRPTADELLKHPFLHTDYGGVFSCPPPLKKKTSENSPVVFTTAPKPADTMNCVAEPSAE